MIKLDERGLIAGNRAVGAKHGLAPGLQDIGLAVSAYLAAALRPIDDGAKTGEPMLLRVEPGIDAPQARSHYAKCPFVIARYDLLAPADAYYVWLVGNSALPRHWPTHYAPLAALVDLEG